jgi:flagellar motility protein MotE (MotC chaperone)
MTPLKAADGEIYAVGQGSLIVSGFTAQGQAEQLTQGVPTAGRIPNGGLVERAVDAEFGDQAILTLQLRNPDFSTAVRIADAINDYTSHRFGARLAAENDARTVSIRKPRKISAARFYAELENLVVESDTPARVVVDSRTGTIVIGNEVKISRVAISHGTLTVRITEAPTVVQPEPFSRGETAVEPNTAIEATQPDAKVAVLDGPDLQTLAVTTLPAFATETVRQVLPGGQDAAQPQQLARETSPADAPGPQVQESDVERFCSNIADAARDRRYALQAAELKQLQDEVDKRIKALEDKRSEYESWLKRREVFLARAQEGVVKIYADMKPDAAAERLAAVNAELAAAILMKLEPRKAGVILNEMDTKAAATLTGIMASAARRVDPS